MLPDNGDETVTDREKQGRACTLVYPEHVLEPSDLLHFIELPGFTRVWDDLGYSDDDLHALQVMIMCGPKRHPVIQGTSGLRKMRFARMDSNRGKSSGLRVCYVYFEQYFTVLLAIVYPKSAAVNLTPDQKERVNAAIKRIEEGLGRLQAE